ncbi:glycosyltransferase [Tardiphaga sp. 841_E9_N1_2]|uniref:glycosyltransferase n=1 Tax=Tardiphaga sp. 841_E9_N1_2 TaxID=3240762 RepID=UPI003F257626
MFGRVPPIFQNLARRRYGAALISAGIPLGLVQRLNKASGRGTTAERGARLARFLTVKSLVRAGLMKQPVPINPRVKSAGALQAAVPYVGGRTQIRAVHQFHSGSAVGDAVTNSLFLVQRLLRGLGYESEIFVEHRDPRLSDVLFLADDLPNHDDYVLIVHHSMGHGILDFILSLDARKILMYHNVTPPEFLGDAPWMIPYSELGRRQLVEMRPHMLAALADSEFNMLELQRCGYESPAVSSLLFNLDTLRPRDAGQPPAKPDVTEADPFTVLFVGRVTKSKGQADLVDAFAEFARRYARPSRLVIVGRFDSIEDAYPAEIRRRAAHHHLDERVILTGGVSDEELHRWFNTAHAYVSLSYHEGFGVPLIEAMAHSLPVIAWPCSAIAYTIADAAISLTKRSANAVADALMQLATDQDFRDRVVARQLAFISRYELDRHVPALLRALAAAGARLPLDPDTRRGIFRNLHTTFVGHVQGAYSLAAVNRSMATTMEAERPGHQRVIPWENGPVADFGGGSAAQANIIASLASRDEPPTEPQIVISQHYPIHVPDVPGHKFAMLFWEESLLPPAIVQALNEDFEAILAPTTFVTKSLIDSGVWRPILDVGYSPDLSGYRKIGLERSATPAERPFTFLHVSSCFPRKGADVLIAAYAKAFRREDTVRLVIKTFSNPHNDIAEQVAKLRREDPEIADITVIEQDFDDDQMLALFREADAMVLPTRGEGFNLPAAEAMAAGMPLIVTGYGGHADFTSSDNCRFVAFHFARSASHVADNSSLWVEPNLDDLTAAFREIHQERLDSNSASRLKARRAASDIERSLARAPWVERLVDGAIDVISTSAKALRVGWISTWDVKCGVAEYSRFLLDRMIEKTAPDAIRLTILSDDRTPAKDGATRPQIVPAWTMLEESGVMDRLARSVSVSDPEVLVIQHQPGLISWQDLAKLLRDTRLATRVTVVVLHSVPTLAKLPEDERNSIIAALRRSTRVLVHQIADLNRLKDWGLIGNVTYFPHGAPERFNASEARQLTGSSAPVIGSYGFFLPGKGLSKLIHALVNLRQKWPNIRLRLVNAEYESATSTDEIARCKALAKTLGVFELIEWKTDFQTDNSSLAQLTECDLLILPYDESPESASGAVRIALASGTPVAVTPAAIFDELGTAVVRFDGFEQHAVDRGIAQLLGDHDARKEMQTNAATWLAQRNWQVLASRLNGMLRGLHASRAKDRS